MNKNCKFKIDTKKINIRVPALHTGKAYGTLKEFAKKEEWHSNGDLECLVEIPSGLVMDFYDKLNAQTHGSIMAEEIK